MVSKTREKLIEVARQLFIKKGVENTTMNDIATASEKGRRTVYTYFKNKKEIFNAVVSQQSDKIIEELRALSHLPLPPLDKLRNYLTERFLLFDRLTQQSEKIHNFFNRDHRRIERIYRQTVEKEGAILDSMMSEGIAAGVFDAVQAARLSGFIAIVSQMPDTSVRISASDSKANVEIMRGKAIEFIIKGIVKSNNNNNSLL